MGKTVSLYEPALLVYCGVTGAHLGLCVNSFLTQGILTCHHHTAEHWEVDSALSVTGHLILHTPLQQWGLYSFFLYCFGTFTHGVSVMDYSTMPDNSYSQSNLGVGKTLSINFLNCHGMEDRLIDPLDCGE